MLGIIDDVIGVTEAGYQAREMNALMNIKSAEKKLQFGISKCKTILVGKSIHNFHQQNLHVDCWDVKHTPVDCFDQSDGNSCDTQLNEKYIGRLVMKSVSDYKYLGHHISNKNNNMVHI